MTPEMVLLCNVTHPKRTYVDVVFSSEGAAKSTEYAEKIATVFRDILVFLRIWDYSPKSKQCTISPLFEAGKIQNYQA